MFFFGHYMSENEPVEKSKGKGRGHRGGKNSDLMLIEVTRKDGVVQHYWKAPEDVKAGDKVVRVKQGNDPAPSPLKALKKGIKSVIASVFPNGGMSIKRLKAQIKHAKARSEMYKKHSLKVLDPKAQILKAKNPGQEADDIIEHYKKMMEKDPELAQQMAARLPAFIEYFGTAKPTHTTSSNSLARMLISNRMMSGSQVREFTKKLAEEESAALIMTLHNMRKRDEDHIRNNIIKPTAAGLQKRIELMEAKAAASGGNTTAAAKTELAALKRFQGGLEAQFELYATVANSGMSTVPGVSNKVNVMRDTKIFVAEALKQLRMSEGVGLNNSTDARVGVDSKVFVAMHPTVRYQRSMDRPATMVFKREVLAKEGSTITMQNACEYVAPRKDKDGVYRTGVEEGLLVKAEDLLKGKTVLRDLDDPKTVLALAMNAAYHFDIKNYNAKYLNQNPDVKPASAGPKEMDRRWKAGETMAKPVKLVEGHLESSDLEHLESIVFKRKEDMEAMKELFPEHASKMDWHDEPDELIAIMANPKKVDVEFPFELVEGRYVVRR